MWRGVWCAMRRQCACPAPPAMFSTLKPSSSASVKHIQSPPHTMSLSWIIALPPKGTSRAPRKLPSSEVTEPELASKPSREVPSSAVSP